LNIIFPSWLILLTMAITLVTSTGVCFQKAMQMWRKETHPARLEIVDPASSYPRRTLRFESELELMANPSLELSSILNVEAQFPWKSMTAMCSILVLVTVVSLLRGSSKGSSIVGIEVCSVWYWLLGGLLICTLGLTEIFVCMFLHHQHTMKTQLGYNFQDGDIHWTLSRMTIISSVSVGAGILAAMLGIGGGMILSPLMLSLGVLPEVTSATSTFMILVTSLSAMTQYLSMGELPLDYGVCFAAVGLVSAVVGQQLTDLLVKRFQKKSLIVFAIAAVLGASTVLLISAGTVNLLNSAQHRDFGFQSPCKLT